jgi:hypothetical protein
VLGVLEQVEVILREAGRQRAQTGETYYRWTSLFVPIGRSRS